MTFGSSFSAQTSNLPQKVKDDFEKMSYQVELKKNTYVLSEPIFLKFSFSNLTKNTITTHKPVFMSESKLEVRFNGKVTNFRELTPSNSMPYRFPNSILPNGILSDEGMISPPYVGLFFPEAGKYQIKFILVSADANKNIESDTIELEIIKPQGIDKEAFEFLKKHEDFFGLSSWTCGTKNAEVLLETFVNNFSQSVYGELSISSLGYLYLCENKLDKAKIEFEKIKSSSNKSFADDAKIALKNIEDKKACLEK